MSQSRFVITGAVGGSPNRLEINNLVKDEKLFSLYIQALQVMFANDQDQIQSFFSVSGIHGLPNISWDGATGDPPFDPSSGQWGGYCTHGSVLFPTWHRPYVMLYEQILQKRAEEVAATYTVDTENWKQAAAGLRQPYWDWAANAVPPDEVIAQKQVTITGKDGNKVTVDNPLYHYSFHPIDPSFPDPYSNWQTTFRQPTSQDSNATDDVDMLKNVLASAQSQITSSTYNLLSRVHTWPAFSNHTVGDGGSASNSLEGIHDGIHVDVGGGGQMADPSVAAFDPIFFLHHCNVDRMLSLWAALNPGLWVTPGIAEDGGSFTTPPGAPYDKNTALTPFWDNQTSFWASSAVTDTSKLGYTYPEFNGVDLSNPDAARTAIGNKVNELYASSVFGSFADVPRSLPALVSGLKDTAKKAAGHIRDIVSPSSQSRAIPSSHSREIPSSHSSAAPPSHSQAPPSSHSREIPPSHSSAAPHQHPSSIQVSDHHQAHMSIHPHPTSAPPNHGVWDWTARVEFKKYELGTSFSVLIFLGQVPENPQEWRISPNYVGGHHAFVNSAANSCGNCRNQQDLVIEGFVHLNQAIVKHSGLGSLEPNLVEPYLTRNLHWKVQKSNGEVAELQSLEVAVIATPLSYPPGAMFPVPGQGRRYNRITHGRNGGSRHA